MNEVACVHPRVGQTNLVNLCTAACDFGCRATSPSPARWVTLPGDDRQHRSSNDCPCTPIVWPGGAVEHR